MNPVPSRLHTVIDDQAKFRSYGEGRMMASSTLGRDGDVYGMAGFYQQIRTFEEMGH
ncbi:hypothetical protein BDZ89DRAFT_1063991 [Hymenopellis radicata]|nr:hypothetical protein BDZ89DRAFT_1063991 [Hymenopellis radicata]